jgi:purine-binding chemotaxis protein CheW
MKKSINKTSYLLFFKVGDKEFASDVSDIAAVLEIEEYKPVSKDSSEFIRGGVVYQGISVPVFDLSAKMNVDAEEIEQKNVLILELCCNDVYFFVGILVNQVKNVLQIEGEEIKPPFHQVFEDEFLYSEGEVLLSGISVAVIDIKKVFKTDELNSLRIAQFSLS